MAALRWLFCVALLGATLNAAAAPKAQDGVIDLSQWDIDAGHVALDGQWAFRYGVLLSPDGPLELGETLQVPGTWASQRSDLPGTGAATYVLTLELPEAAVGRELALDWSNTRATRLWVDGQERANWGQVDVDTSVPGSGSRLVTLHPTSTSVTLVAHVANHDHRVGGLRKRIEIGDAASIETGARGMLAGELGLMLVFIVAAFYHLGVSVLRRQEKAQLWFGLFCALQALRIASSKLFYLAPVEGAAWVWALKFEYLGLFLGLPTGLAMMQTLYPDELRAGPLKAVQIITAAMCALVVFTPATLYSHSLGPFQLLAVTGLLYVGYGLFQAARQKRRRAKTLLTVLLLFSLTVVHDSLKAQELFESRFDLMYPGLLMFLGMQAWALTSAYVESYRRVERLSENLLTTNRNLTETHKAIQRFVPYEFLSLLDRRNIREIQRGDHVRMEMGVLFCDMRAFTSTLEQMSPDEAFDFINRYLHRMEPAIHDHGGFISAYLGDAIMALFPSGAGEGVQAAVEMLAKLQEFNAEQRERTEPQVKVGIGLHSGHLMLGTIGGESRIECSVVGDAVNLASRLEGMTKMYGSSIVISESVYTKLSPDDAPQIRELDWVVAKGRKEPIKIFEVLENLPADELAAKREQREPFEQAIQAYRAGELRSALDQFEAVLAHWSRDLAAELYASRCRHYLREGLPEGWEGVTVLHQK